MDSDRFDERHPELVRQLKRDMADEMQSQTGGGYVPGYYADLAGPFVSIAIHFAEAAARAEREGRTD